MLSDVESICVRNFIPASLFNEWLEKHGIIRNQFQELRQPENFTVSNFFKYSNCSGCSTWGSRKFDKIFR